MSKRKEDIENFAVKRVIPLRPPTIDEPKKVSTLPRCEWCKEKIYTQLDDYLIVDDMLFCSDNCAAEHYMNNAGGRRVHGGAC